MSRVPTGMRKARKAMSQRTKLRIGAIPQTTLRRLRNTPTYFFLIWRWTWWFYAFAWIILSPKHPLFLFILLGITLLQTLVVTLYAPVFKLLLPSVGSKRNRLPANTMQAKQRRGFRLRRKTLLPIAADEALETLPPLARSSNRYKNIAIYGLDVIICGLATYFSAIYSFPPFGDGSPFYRYGFSTVFVAAFTFRYRGGLAAAIGYDLFVLLGLFLPPPLAPPNYHLTVQDLLGSLFDAPLVAIFAAYMSKLMNVYTQSRRNAQDSMRRQRALLRVGGTLVTGAGASDRQRLLQQSIDEIRRGVHFEHLIIALITHSDNGKSDVPEIETYLDTGVAPAGTSEESEMLVEQVAQTGEKLHTFETREREGDEIVGIAHLYLPIEDKDKRVYMVLGGESQRSTYFDERQENFLKIVGTQLVIALENIRLTEQTADLAAAAERGRIAREIHDGVAQLIYMLSLSIETCATLVQRIADTSDEEANALAPVTQRLEKLVTISKQALWETRHYMFTLKPLISGTSTLTQMLSSQLHEFESISGLPVQFEVEGSEESPNGDKRRARRHAQVGTAIFRITQEALTNAYKHANATHLQVCLRHQPHAVEVEIRDNGKGIPVMALSKNAEGESEQRFYSGHGMRGMRERAEELGGTFEVTQTPTGGVSVLARIPM
jgi:signal transduction histidine kinase